MSAEKEKTEKRQKLFLSIGLDKRRSVTTCKNEQLSAILEDILLNKAKITAETGTEKAKGLLLYDLAVNISKNGMDDKFISKIVSHVMDGGIASKVSLDEAIKYVQTTANFDEEAFKTQAGIGLVVSVDVVKSAVDAMIERNKDAITKQRYQFNRGRLMGQLSKDPLLKFADGKLIRSTLWSSLDAFLGEKTAADIEAAKPKKKKAPTTAASSSSSSGASSSNQSAPPNSSLVKPTDRTFKRIRLLDIARQLNGASTSTGRTSAIGMNVELRGWCHSVRPGRKMQFIELRDGSTPFGQYLQCVLVDKCALTQEAIDLRRESSVALFGTIVKRDKTPSRCFDDIELQVDYWQLVGDAPVDLEDLVNKDTHDDKLFDLRHIVLRQDRPSAYMRLRSRFLLAVREHFADRGYNELIPPTIVQTQCEGGATLFEFDFYSERAFLTQSSQLYLETVLPSLGNVFCIAQSYRAEKFRTRRHVSEYTHLEAELPFITFEDLLDAIEDLICDSIDRMLKSPVGKLLKQINPDIKVPKRPFNRLDYKDAITFCKENNIKKLAEDGSVLGDFEFGDDIPEAPERKMIEIIGEPTFLCKFPVPIKSFYMPKDPQDKRVTESVDLLIPGVGEVVGGSMRISDYEELMAAYKREGLDASPYYWYTDQRKYGSCPHGGYGLGVERLLVWLFGDNHIKNVSTYPRYPGRATP